MDGLISGYNLLNDNYNKLLDEYTLFKRIANNKYNQKRDIIHEKETEIEEFKRVTLLLKQNLDKLRYICKMKVEAMDLVKIEDNSEKEKEFRSLFEYLKELFNDEIDEKLQETKDKLKKMTEERSELKQIIDQKYVKPSCKRSIKKPTRKKGKTQKKKKKKK